MATFALLALTAAARADDAPATAAAVPPAASSPAGGVESQRPIGAWEDTLAQAVFFEDGFQQDSSAAPALELSAGLDVRVEQKRRKFRAKAVDWMADRSATMGRVTDFMLGGAETGVHMVVDPFGDDQYILEWRIRFR